ncbi:Septum formation protein Maf [hydrothermal vent metagenome]|uniref:Septum formation protein Maf n=1 Tax=hydrothermal vent metagenome TaxID=652676 RepID=A0A1W1CLA4_9ZZZZ
MIHLASNSSSRALLLNKFNIDFIQKAPQYNEEQIESKTAKDFAYIASKGKLESAIKEFGLKIPLLTADSVILSADGELLRKPKNIDDAKRILELQSGSSMAIISAMHYKSQDFYMSDVSATYYKFSTFEKEDLEEYLEGGLWQGKAGGCMVEGFCKKYIKSVQGNESTAMGLNVERLLGWIKFLAIYNTFAKKII